jgi:hypothetical protein
MWLASAARCEGRSLFSVVCVCVCVCVYVYMHTYVYVYEYIYIYVYMYILIYMYMCTYTYMYICMCICTWMHICMFVCMMYVCMDAHTHTYSQHPDVCIHLHTWIHTHIQTGNTLTRGGQRRGVLSAVITYIICCRVPSLHISSTFVCSHHLYHLHTYTKGG